MKSDYIKEAKQKLTIPIRVMIRPRGGNFIYSEKELQEMESQIRVCKELGVEAVVFGVLKKDQTLDLEAITKLAKIAKPLKVVIHKAIDETPDILRTTQVLLKIEEIDTILTSGGKETAAEGAAVLMEMMKIAQNRLEIMPAGKISNFNVEDLNREIGAGAYHGKLIVGALQ